MNQDPKNFLSRFRQARILVVGDLMLDHFIWGQVTRISPEAPVPVVNVTSETLLLGGAANVYHNIVKLGGTAILSGVIGSDDSGESLLRLVKEQGGGVEGIFELNAHPTTKKTRVIAHNQQVVRFDHEKFDSILPSLHDKILSFIGEQVNHIDCLVLSDYAKGVITPELMDGIRGLSMKRTVKTIVDPKVSHMSMYRGAALITPNHLEASRATGIEIKNETDLVKAGQSLLNMLACEAVLITRGDQGMSLFEESGKVVHIPTVAKEVYDVTGAGDTVVSVLALALAAGASYSEAAILSNYAASIVVGIVGTATVRLEQLERLIDGSRL